MLVLQKVWDGSDATPQYRLCFITSHMRVLMWALRNGKSRRSVMIARDPLSLTTVISQKTRATTTAVGTKLAVPKPVNLPSMRKVGLLAARCACCWF